MPRFSVFWSCASVFVAGAVSAVSAADMPTELAKNAQAVLREHCYVCHGEGGTIEGGFNYVLNRNRLTRRRLVVPNSPDESRLFELVSNGQMPSGGPPLPKGDQEKLRRWIEAGAPPFTAEAKPVFISPAEMLGFISRDLEKAPVRDRQFLRYFTLTHLKNAGFDDNELESYRQGLSKLVNSLSWGKEIRVPQPIDPLKTILRIDLRHYKWNENDAWTRIISADPYHVTYSFTSAKSSYEMTRCDLPHVRADWFVFAASRPPLYHDVLDIPEQVETLEARVEVNVARNLVDYNEVQRAAFFPSGVSKSNRLIERHPSTYGAYWKSYDFKPINPADKQPKRRDLKANPLGPTTCGEMADKQKFFEHDGGEIIFHLPNGLQGYMLTDAVGKRIDKGPTDVVVDKEAVKRGRDPEVVNGVSCMSCHWSGMLNKTDQIRDHVLTRTKSFTTAEVEAVTELYAPKPAFAAKLMEDRGRFETAVKKCGLSELSKTEPVSTLAYLFEEPLDLDLAAAESGVPTERFQAALESNAALGRSLGGLVQGQPLPRDTFVASFAALSLELKLGRYVAPTLKTEDQSDSVPSLALFDATRARTAAEAKAAQQAWATQLGLKVIERNSVGMDLVLIPPGKFMMGSPADETDRSEDEDQIAVTLTRALSIGRTEVTQGQWRAVMGTEPWKGKQFVKEGADYAATYVSWEDAEAFCAKLGGKEGMKYRLLTEAEWEYACRAGTLTRYGFGDDESQLGQYAWLDKNASDIEEKYAHQVGLKKPNAFGLQDMHGNVYEWCQDWYGEKLPGGENPHVSSGGSFRVSRGGSWWRLRRVCRSASRYRFSPDGRFSILGFRVARVPSNK